MSPLQEILPVHDTLYFAHFIPLEMQQASLHICIDNILIIVLQRYKQVICVAKNNKHRVKIQYKVK
jgi:hypothetical protein